MTSQLKHAPALTLITGASEGLGAAMARELAIRQHDLILVARNQTRLDELAASLRQEFSTRVTICAGDLTDQGFLETILDTVRKGERPLTYAINNAGMGLPLDFDQTKPESVAALCDLNIKAVTYLTHGFLRHMLPHGGTILNVGSLGGFMTIPSQTSYYASKTFIRSFSQGLDFTYRRKGVRICCACPGTVATELHKKMGSADGLYLKLFRPQNPKSTAKTMINAMIAGRSICVPGPLNSLFALGMSILPNWLLMPIFGPLFKRPKP